MLRSVRSVTMNSGTQDVFKQGLEAVLRGFRPDPQSQVPLSVQKAVYLAGLLQARATALQTPAERRQQAELDRMMQRPEDKSTLMQITDQAFRARSPYRVADQLTHVLDVQGVPRFFSPLERAALKGFPVLRQLSARRGRAAGQGVHAA